MAQGHAGSITLLPLSKDGPTSARTGQAGEGRRKVVFLEPPVHAGSGSVCATAWRSRIIASAQKGGSVNLPVGSRRLRMGRRRSAGPNYDARLQVQLPHSLGIALLGSLWCAGSKCASGRLWMGWVCAHQAVGRRRRVRDCRVTAAAPTTLAAPGACWAMAPALET